MDVKNPGIVYVAVFKRWTFIKHAIMTIFIFWSSNI